MDEAASVLVMRERGEGRLIKAAGDLYRFVAESSETGGRAAIWDAEVPPGGGPPLHLHRNEAEAFFVYEGEVEFSANGARRRLGRGGFVHLPEGVPHAFWNPTPRPARMLIMVFPGGLERMFSETGVAAAAEDTACGATDEAELELLKAAAPRYGIELLGPPLSASTGR